MCESVGSSVLQMAGDDSDVMQFEQHRKEYIEIIRELRKKHPNMDRKGLEEMAEYEVNERVSELSGQNSLAPTHGAAETILHAHQPQLQTCKILLFTGLQLRDPLAYLTSRI